MAILTPDIQFAFPHVLNLTYFCSHALIIVGAAFMTVNYGYRPSFKSFLRALVLTNIYMALEIIGTALFLIMYSPYLIADHLRARPKPPSQTRPLDG
ncbi:MAG TPA: hypothetical protein VMZ06_16305 [Candidatus Bathyarchaeia archaeon]|nr:hypothetical protein [Candidatus Bathyarchaeia archaeon]